MYSEAELKSLAIEVLDDWMNLIKSSAKGSQQSTQSNKQISREPLV